jgi:6-phosphogluconolactonase
LKLQINCLLSSRELCEKASESWLQGLQAEPRARRVYTVALSGGRVAAEFFSALCRCHTQGLCIPEGVHFFWADERCVPPDDAESNFRVAKDQLFAPLQIPSERIHRILGELDPELAAEQAETELKKVATRSTPEGIPILDMVFLGMGEDGHTASLFPGAHIQKHEDGNAEVCGTQAGAYIAVVGPKPPPRRVSLTYESLRSAAEVWALVSGRGKASTLARVLAGEGAEPMGRVLKERAETVIWTDSFF